jgi:uncharacterized membrane protein
MSEPKVGTGIRINWGMVLWAAIVVLSTYYIYRAVNFRFLTPGQLGETLLNKQLFYWSHFLFLVPVYLFGPLQFLPKLRTRRPKLHRWLGRVYVAGATVGALTAIWLGATIDPEYEGSRVPIVIAASLWLFFTQAAFWCALKRDYMAHRQFMIRSYGMALVLVWLRIIGDLPHDVIFFYIENPSIRDTTQEWLSWVPALLVMEFGLSWWPLLKGRQRAKVPAGAAIRNDG